MKKKRIGLIGTVLCCALVAGGCGGGNKAASQEKTESETNKAVITTEGTDVTAGTGNSDKDSLVFVINAEPNTLEPGASSSSDSYSRICMIQVYDTLLREKIGDRTTLEPLLAENWEFENDGKTVLFTLKKDVKFQDGDVMTAEDVAFSLNRAIAQPNNLDISSMMVEAKVVDDTHVALDLEYAYSPVLNILVNPAFAIISKDYYEKCEAEGINFGRNPMGTGAYRFIEWQNGANIKYEAFDQWHGGEVAIKNLEIRFMGDVTTGAIALESGDCDLFYGVDSADLPRLRSNPELNVLSVQSSGFYFIALNSASGALADQKVRQAVSYAINRQEIIDGGQDGVGWVTECPITPGIFGYQEDFHANAQDIEKAKALLAEAGYANGLTIKMKTPESSYYSRPAQVIQEQLRQVGITVELSTMERGAFNNDVANRDYESIYFWVGASYPDADNIVYKLFNKEFANATGATNMANVVNDDADRIVKEARTTIDKDTRYKLYGELSQLNNDNAWYIPILTSTNTICARADVAGAYGNSAGFYYVSDLSY